MNIYNSVKTTNLYWLLWSNCIGCGASTMLKFEPSRTRENGRTLTDQLMTAIIAAIESRQLAPGAALASVRESARLHGISTFTVATAYSRLVQQGWLTARPGAGYRVALRTDTVAPARPMPAWEPPSVSAAWLLSDIYADHSIPIKAGCGWLPTPWLNEYGLHTAMRQLTRLPASQLGGYGHPYGFQPLRDVIARELGEQGLPVDAGQVLLTQGATHALDLVTRTLLAPGDTVVVEQPCYANLLQLLRLHGLRIVAVRCGAQGYDCDALERVIMEHAPKAVFVNPVLQNPTGATLSMASAFRLLQLAQRHDMWVIEDDVSRALSPHVAPMLAALDGAQRVVYVGGYTKTISPSMRVGFIVAQARVLSDLARTKMAVGLTSPELMERLVHRVIAEGHYRAYLGAVRERLALAHEHAERMIDGLGLSCPVRPRAGLFLWVGLESLRQGANALAQQALRDGIWLAPGSYFDAAHADIAWMRLNVAFADAPPLWRFLEGVRRS